MKYRKLAVHGGEIMVSTISLGTGSFGAFYGAVDEEEGIRLVRETLKSGVNLIDTSPWYGQGKSETLLGKALQGVPRNSYYLATKVGRYELDYLKMFDFSYQKTIDSVNSSFDKLQVSHIDFIQIHDFEFLSDFSIIFHQTLPALMTFIQSNKCSYIGITSYSIQKIQDLISLNESLSFSSSKFPISTILTYSRFVLYETILLRQLEFFSSRGIGVINAAPVSMGILTDSGPPAWHPASEKLKKRCKLASEYALSENVSISKLAVYFSTHNKKIPTTLVSSPKENLMRENVETARSEKLSEKEEKILEEIMKRFFEDLTEEDTDWSEQEQKKYKAKYEQALKEKRDKEEKGEEKGEEK
eukprot:TRINITY_DN437_c0_g1_i2.p1 TRINITY_DN437_c0_g1~~TRINITY_DN437_c0_g1_i2.p1  ORF type:complete len:391 (-),score=91.69 TRINITY_DN437_c0_g1_i2:334-1407(-)